MFRRETLVPASETSAISPALVSTKTSTGCVTVGANGVIDTNTATHPVEVFVLTNAGLMADVSLAGTKVSRLNI